MKNFSEIIQIGLLIIYTLLVMARIYEKIGNYKDTKKANKIEIEIKTGNEEKKGALSGANRSSNFIKGINNMKRQYEFEKKKEKRKFIRELLESFILK